MSVVLVIIGLIVGGVLAGRDLIAASEARATLSQIEKYQSAVNVFNNKYGALPGDMSSSAAVQFGFAARSGTRGQGDGNRLLEGIDQSGNPYNNAVSAGETAMFWVDLSRAGLIDGGFNMAGFTTAVAASGAQLALYMPAAKLGRGNYVYVWGGGWSGTDGNNYFGIEGVSDFNLSYGSPDAVLALTVKQAYDIDKKMDDGLAMTGNITTIYDDHTNLWAGTSYSGGPTTAATAGSATTCFDNSTASSGTPGVNGNQQHYSIEISGGSNLNCALAFRFQ